MSWDAVKDNGSKSSGDKKEVNYLQVPIGKTKFRVLDAAPYAYEEYWSSKGNGGKGTSIPYKGKDCLLEKENKEYLDRELPKAKQIKDEKKRKAAMRKVYQGQPWKRRKKFAINVLDRATGQVAILDKGLAVFKELRKYQEDAEYGDLRNYDVTLERTGEGLETEYTVIPARNNIPLTAEEQALELFDLEEVKDHSYVTPEQLLRIAKGETWEDVLNEGKDEDDQDVATEADEPTSEQESTDEDGVSEEELENLEF